MVPIEILFENRFNILMASKDIYGCFLIESDCQSILGDFLDTEVKDWRDGDIVYINATSFSDKMLDDISAIAGGLYVAQ